jgi:hypothetical protein
VILTGITDFVSRGDLIDRALFLHLPVIGEEERRTEAAFWKDFDAESPRLLGALLDAVAGGLRELPNIHLTGMPRMADFAMFGESTSRALGYPPDHFLDAYRDNRLTANESALEDSPVAAAVRELVSRGPWTGTAGQLLDELGKTSSGTPFATIATGAGSRTATDRWPRSPRGMSGVIRRLAPAFRAVGIEVELGRSHDRYITIRTAPRKDGIQPTQPAQPTPPLVLQSETCVGPASVEQPAQPPTQTGAATDAMQPFGVQRVTQNGVGRDGRDGRIPTQSIAPDPWIEEGEWTA